MPVASSTHVVGHAQVDGRRYVTETHVLTSGGEYRITYLADPGTDYVAVRTARVASLNDLLAETEFKELIWL